MNITYITSQFTWDDLFFFVDNLTQPFSRERANLIKKRGANCWPDHSFLMHHVGPMWSSKIINYLLNLYSILEFYTLEREMLTVIIKINEHYKRNTFHNFLIHVYDLNVNFLKITSNFRSFLKILNKIKRSSNYCNFWL